MYYGNACQIILTAKTAKSNSPYTKNTIEFQPERLSKATSTQFGPNLFYTNQLSDIAIHCINLYPVDSATGVFNPYPLDRDLSDGANHLLNNRGKKV